MFVWRYRRPIIHRPMLVTVALIYALPQIVLYIPFKL